MANSNTTKLEQYADLQPLIQKEIETQFDKLYQQYATKYGVASTPLHRHNGFDAPQISSDDLQWGLRASGSINLATNGQRYTLQLTGNPSQILFYGNATRTSSSGRTFNLSGTANATSGAVYTNNGHSYTVATTITNGTVLTTSNGGTPQTSGTLTKSSGTGDATIAFTSSSTIDVRAFVIGSAQLGPSYFFQPLNTTTVSPSEVIGNVIQSCSSIVINNSGTGAPTQAIASEGHIISVEFPGGTVVARATVPNVWTGPHLTSQGYGSGYIFLDVELATGWEIDGNFVVT